MISDWVVLLLDFVSCALFSSLCFKFRGLLIGTEMTLSEEINVVC